MRSAASLLLAVSMVGLLGVAAWAGAARAQGAPAAAAAEESASRRISIGERGTVADVLRAIAREGGINLAVQGRLDAPAELHLKNVTPEEALRAVAQGWDLELEQRGTVWTVRARGARAEAGAGMMDRPMDAQPVAAETAPARVGFGRSVSVGKDEVVEKVVVYGGAARIEGRVLGNVTVFGGELALGPAAHVGGNVDTFGGSVTRHPGARIEGQIRTLGTMRMEDVAPGASEDAADWEEASPADPNTQRVPPAAVDPAPEGAVRSRAATFLSWFATLFIVGFLASMLAPERMKVVQKQIRSAPGVSLAVGLAATVALVPLTVLLLITLVGIPIALLVVWPAAFVSAGVGFAAVAFEVGARIPLFRGRKSQAIVLALGLASLLLVAQVPVLGPLVMVASAFCGFGAVLRSRFGRPGPAKLPVAVPI